MCDIEIDLPDLILLEDFSGNYQFFIDAVYKVFESDFVKSKPHFRGTKLGLKKHPEYQERAYTFYHMTHTGEDEQNREPDLRRCERIPWAKPVIENCDKWKLKVWEQERKGEKRICIWLEFEDEPDYIIILNIRKDYILPWTAYVLEYGNQKRKKQKEYEEWLKTQKTPSKT